MSFAAPTLDKYSSWTAHAVFSSGRITPVPVLDILTNESAVISLASNGVRVSTRGGLQRYSSAYAVLLDLISQISEFS